MNKRDAAAQIAAYGLRMTTVEGAYRVAFTTGSKASQELSAYYTDDLADAVGTAEFMAREAGII